MKILKAKYLLLCDEKFTILKDKCIVFDDKIVEILDFKTACKKYQNAEILDFSNDIAMPGLINTHVHLEFSANKYELIYGEFTSWVKSIVKARKNLSQKASDELILKQIKIMQESGVSTIGEVSSFARELQICAKSGVRFVFFNEILGLGEPKEIIKNFTSRLNESMKLANSLFIPAISVHSPYSTQPYLTKFATDLARSENLVVCSHFMESKAEKMWLKNGNGKFEKWLGAFNANPKPLYTAQSFIENFNGIKTLFTHAVWAENFDMFDKNLHSITHCAVSNSLLSQKALNLKKLLRSGISFDIGTDGLSSNISLNFFDELRANLLIHSDINLQNLSRHLLLASTRNAAKNLGLNLGELSNGKIADIAVFKGFEAQKNQIPLQLILQTKKAKALFIKGEKCNF